MGADLFESCVGSIVAAMILGFSIPEFGVNGVYLPLAIAGAGILASIVGTFFVDGKKGNIHGALKNGLWIASLLVVIASYYLTQFFLPEDQFMNVFGAMVSSLLVGIIIGLITEYYTSDL